MAASDESFTVSVTDFSSDSAISDGWQELTKSDYAKVIFSDLLCNAVSGTVECKFQITDNVHEDPNDYVGLYRIGYEDLSQCLVSKMLSQTKCEDDGKLQRCVFTANELPCLDDGFYQFLYVTRDQEVCGASMPFEIKMSPLQLEECPVQSGVSEKMEGGFLLVINEVERNVKEESSEQAKASVQRSALSEQKKEEIAAWVSQNPDYSALIEQIKEHTYTIDALQQSKDLAMKEVAQLYKIINEQNGELSQLKNMLAAYEEKVKMSQCLLEEKNNEVIQLRNMEIAFKVRAKEEGLVREEQQTEISDLKKELEQMRKVLEEKECQQVTAEIGGLSMENLIQKAQDFVPIISNAIKNLDFTHEDEVEKFFQLKIHFLIILSKMTRATDLANVCDRKGVNKTIHRIIAKDVKGNSCVGSTSCALESGNSLLTNSNTNAPEVKKEVAPKKDVQKSPAKKKFEMLENEVIENKTTKRLPNQAMQIPQIIPMKAYKPVVVEGLSVAKVLNHKGHEQISVSPSMDIVSSCSKNPETSRCGQTARSRSFGEVDDEHPKTEAVLEKEQKHANNAQERISACELNDAFKELGQMCSLHLKTEGVMTNMEILNQAVRVIADLGYRVREKDLNYEVAWIKQREKDNNEELPKEPLSNPGQPHLIDLMPQIISSPSSQLERMEHQIIELPRLDVINTDTAATLLADKPLDAEDITVINRLTEKIIKRGFNLYEAIEMVDDSSSDCGSDVSEISECSSVKKDLLSVARVMETLSSLSNQTSLEDLVVVGNEEDKNLICRDKLDVLLQKCALHYQIEILLEHIEKQKEGMKKVSDKICELLTKCMLLKDEVSDSQVVCEKLKTVIDKKDKHISKLTGELEFKNNLLHHFCSEKEELESRAELSERTIEDFRARIIEASNLYKNQYKEIEKLSKKLRKYKSVKDKIKASKSESSMSFSESSKTASSFEIVQEGSVQNVNDSDTGEHMFGKATLASNETNQCPKSSTWYPSACQSPSLNLLDGKDLLPSTKDLKSEHLAERTTDDKPNSEIAECKSYQCTSFFSDFPSYEHFQEIIKEHFANIKKPSASRNSQECCISCFLCKDIFPFGPEEPSDLMNHFEKEHSMKICPVCGQLFEDAIPPKYFHIHVDQHFITE